MWNADRNPTAKRQQCLSLQLLDFFEVSVSRSPDPQILQ